MRRTGPVFLLLVALVAVGFPMRADAASLASVSPIAQDRSVEPVVLTGAQFPTWSAGPEITAREPTQPPNSGCENHESDGLNHNCSQPSRIPNNPNVGAAVDRLLGYRWDGATNAFKQIPMQVDERFTRYISNLASNCTEAGPFCVGFGAYAGADAQLSYAFDRDTYKFTEGVCSAEMKPGEHAEADPVKGLDNNDELAFLYRDAGGQAPPGAPVPSGIAELKGVRIDDPAAPDSAPLYAYVGLASGPVTPTFTATNSYMRYVRDADADRYAKTSDNYGNAPKGTVCDDAGHVIATNVARRPRDTAWVLTPRYAFRYAGRWILRGVKVAPGNRTEPLDSPADYGPPLVDQWKARAYAQTPDDEVPCCGFETEQDNWGGSSVTLGERSGPVRVIRTTWGADSGTNTIRNEIFYPDLILQQTNLRVHPIPPLGGIFSYWDHSAGVVTKYYNPQHPEGIKVDGVNDEVVGTMHVSVKQGGVEVRDDDPIPVVGPQDVSAGADGGCLGECSNFDVTDPFLNASGTYTWEQVSGQYGSMIFRTHLNQTTVGDAQSLASIPYYRDDACFDDGTGIDPGPHTNPKNADPSRPCWTQGDPSPDPRFRQGLIGAHGVQVLFAAETDNAMMTVPVDEISAETRMVVLPGDPGNVGELYGHADQLPLQATAADAPATDQTSIAITGDVSGKIGGHSHLGASLSDSLGPVADAPLRFTLQGMTYDATTDAQGNADVSDVRVTGPAGTTDLVVTYEGDGLLRSPSYERADFVVGKGDSSLAFDPDSASSGKIHHDTHLAAKLTDASGPVAGATLGFTFQGTTYTATTDANGVGSKDVAVKGPVGDTELSVSFNGDASHVAASTNRTFTVAPDDSALSFEPASESSGKVNHSAHFAAKLTDGSGPVSDAALTFAFQGGAYVATTDASGVASTDVAVQGPTGSTDLSVRFDGDATHSAASASSTFIVSPDDTALAFDPSSDSSGQANHTAHLAAKLADTSGPLAGATLGFTFQGSSYTATTDGNGVASRNVTIKGPAGETDLTVRFNGDATHAASMASRSFTVTNDDGTVTFEPTSATAGKINDSVTFVAKLRDAGGPVSGSTLHFDIQGVAYDATTDGQGVASVPVVVKGPAGDITVGVRSDGDATRNAGSATAPFTVTKRNSRISITAENGSTKTVVVNTTLTDADTSGGIPGRSVYIFVDGVQKATASTDGEGRATVTFKLNNPKGKTFRVAFSGDDTYLARSVQAKFNKNGASGSA